MGCVSETGPSVRGTYVSGHWSPPCVPCPGCASVTEAYLLQSCTTMYHVLQVTSVVLYKSSRDHFTF